MLGGGAFTALVGMFLIIATIADKNALTDSSGKKLTTGEFTSSIVSTVIIYLILVVMWVLMARLNRAGTRMGAERRLGLRAISTINAYSSINWLHAAARPSPWPTSCSSSSRSPCG